MSNPINQGQGQQGFYGNSGFNTGNTANGATTGGGGNGQPQQGQQSQNNGTATTTSASGPPSVGGPPSNLNTNVPTPGGTGSQAGPASNTTVTGAATTTANASTGALAQALAAPTTTTAAADGTMTSQAQPPTTMNPQQQQQAKELNAASLCRYGQETVQEIVSRTQELYQTLRGAQPPDGKIPSQAMDRKPKFQETLRNIRGLYKRLRVIYDKIEESFPTSNDLSLEERIPYSDHECEPMNEKRDTEAFRTAMEEYEEVKEMVIFKNRHLRETMDLMRNIIWDINTMLAMRKE